MSWNQGIPFLGRLPEAYRDREETSWLTVAWDELLIATREQAEAVFATHLDPNTADAKNLDWLAQHYGFTDEFWDVTWSEAIKRTLLRNAYSKIWVERGTIGLLNWMLALHDIPAVLPEKAAYYPDWFRAFDWVLHQTRDFAETWTEEDGTPEELLRLILTALDIEFFEIDGDVVRLPYGGDGLHKPDLDSAIARYKLPFTTSYDRFYAGLSVAGDRVFSVPIVADSSIISVRERTHEDVQVMRYLGQGDPFRYSIRLDSERVERGDPIWVLAERLASAYSPVYMSGGVCFDYFRAGLSVAGDPTFDPDSERSYEALVSATGSVASRLEALLRSYGWDVEVSVTSPGQVTTLRFLDLDQGGDRARFRLAEKLLNWYAPRGMKGGSGVGWEYFFAGQSAANEPVIDWLAEQLNLAELSSLPAVQRVAAILTSLNSVATINAPIISYEPSQVDANPNDWVAVETAIGRYVPGWVVAYDRFYAGLSTAIDWLDRVVRPVLAGLTSEVEAAIALLNHFDASASAELESPIISYYRPTPEDVTAQDQISWIEKAASRFLPTWSVQVYPHFSGSFFANDWVDRRIRSAILPGSSEIEIANVISSQLDIPTEIFDGFLLIDAAVDPGDQVALTAAVTRFLPSWRVAFDSFYAGASTAGEPITDWVYRRVVELAPTLEGMPADETRVMSILSALNSIATIDPSAQWVVFPVERPDSDWRGVQLALDWYVPGWRPIYPEFFAAKSRAGDPVFDTLGVAIALLVDGLTETGAIIQVIEQELNTSFEVFGSYIRLEPGISFEQQIRVTNLVARFLPGLRVVLSEFFAGRSSAGDPA